MLIFVFFLVYSLLRSTECAFYKCNALKTIYHIVQNSVFIIIQRNCTFYCLELLLKDKNVIYMIEENRPLITKDSNDAFLRQTF